MFYRIEIVFDSFHEIHFYILHDGLSEGHNDVGAKCYSYFFSFSSDAKPFHVII